MRIGTSFVNVLDKVLFPCEVSTENGSGEIAEENVPLEDAVLAEVEEVAQSVTPDDVLSYAREQGLNTFADLVEAAGLDETVNGGGITAFVPTDDAFATALDDLGMSVDDLMDNPEQLQEILAFHLLPTDHEIFATFGAGLFRTVLNDIGSSCGVRNIAIKVEGDDAIVEGAETEAKVRQ